MRDKGAYLQFWKKYLPVIRLLLKKTSSGEQKLQLYKHEFEKTGARNKLGYVFTLDVANGKAINGSTKTASASDLFDVMMENEAVAEWLRTQHVRISVNRACEMVMQQLQPVSKPATSPASGSEE